VQDERADVCVVGNGVLGLATAWALLQLDPGLEVVVVGPAARDGAASPAAAAMLNSLAELSEGSRASSAGRARVAVGRLAAKRWPGYLERLGAALREEPPPIRPGTTLILNTQSGGGDEANFETVRGALIELDEPHHEIAPATISGLDPAPDQRPLRALHIPGEGSVDSRAVLAALDAAGRGTGRATVRDAWAQGFVRDAGGRVTGVRLRGGTTIQAGDTVLAAGAGSQRLLDGLDEADRIPWLLAGRGVAAVLRPRAAALSHVVRTPVRSGGCGLHLVPLAGGDLYLGATNEVALAPRRHAGAGAVQGLLTAALGQLGASLYEAEIVEWRVGNRPITLDGFPLVGPTDVPGLWLLGGTYRDGFHCAPVLAEHLARRLLGLPASEVDPRFAPARPLLEARSPEASVEEYARHAASGAIEHGARLPAFLGLGDLEAAARAKAQEVVAWIDEPAGLAPELIDGILCAPRPREAAARFSERMRRLREAHVGTAVPAEVQVSGV
jgi:glycine/D-amino acid oxidase-like deaminating enzyme